MGVFESELQEIAGGMPKDPSWRDLQGEGLASYATSRAVEFALTGHAEPDGELRDVFEHYIATAREEDRITEIATFGEQLEVFRGEGVKALIPFILFDPNGTVSSTAALNLAMMHPLENEDVMTGVRLTVDVIMRSVMDDRSKGAALAGILQIGDMRVNPILASAWDGLGNAGRLALTRSVSPFITAGVVEFWVGCLEKDCDEDVFGSAAAALCKMPRVSRMPMILDIERIFPVYEAVGMPMNLLGEYPFPVYLKKLAARLEKIAEKEPEPKVSPMIFSFWQ